MKKISLIVVLFFSIVSFAQQSYKYVIVPAKFEFLNKENQYNVNSLTKSFFETEGYTVYYDTDQLPADLANNRCQAMMINVIEQNKLFTTNVVVQVKDCQNTILVEGIRGSSREKSLQNAYNEAFRTSLTSLKGRLDFKKSSVVEGNSPIEEKAVEKEVTVYPDNLFAIPVENGYKLVDKVPNTIFTIQNTSVENIFMAQKGNQQGTFLKKMNGWFFEYYQDGKLISEKVNVKF